VPELFPGTSHLGGREGGLGEETDLASRHPGILIHFSPSARVVVWCGVPPRLRFGGVFVLVVVLIISLHIT